jgi:hypothetical protein
MKTNYLKSVRLPILLGFLFFLSFFSCQSNTEMANATENQDVRVAEEKKEMEVTFMISNVEDDINGTQSTIKAMVNGKEIEIIKTTNCNVIEKEEYESKEIPEEARWACTCWWAGAGKDFYAKKEKNKVEFYVKEVYEEMEEEYDKWQLLKTLE